MSAEPGFITKILYHNSPSLEEMKEQFKYRKTLRFYRGLIQDGMMIFPTDLESFPAPVLCTLCEKPVITRAKTERSGLQMYVAATNPRPSMLMQVATDSRSPGRASGLLD